MKNNSRPPPTGSGFTIGVTFFGYAGILLGLLSGISRLFGVEIAL